MASDMPLAQQVGYKLGNATKNGLSFLKGLKPSAVPLTQAGAMTALRTYVPAAAAAQAAYDYGQWKGMQMDEAAADPNSMLSQQMAEIRRNVENGYVPDDEGNWLDVANNEINGSNTISRLNGLIKTQQAPVIQQETVNGLPAETVAALMQASNEAVQASAPKDTKPVDEDLETTKTVSTPVPKVSGSVKKTSVKASTTPAATTQTSTTPVQYEPQSQLSWLDQLLPYLLAGGLGLYAYNSLK